MVEFSLNFLPCRFDDVGFFGAMLFLELGPTFGKHVLPELKGHLTKSEAMFFPAAKRNKKYYMEIISTMGTIFMCKMLIQETSC